MESFAPASTNIETTSFTYVVHIAMCTVVQGITIGVALRTQTSSKVCQRGALDYGLCYTKLDYDDIYIYIYPCFLGLWLGGVP